MGSGNTTVVLKCGMVGISNGTELELLQIPVVDREFGPMTSVPA